MQKKKHIVFIGMPGAGKSTLGVVLAKALGYGFLDSDLVIQEEEGKLLSEIIEELGTEGFNEVENKINSRINPKNPTIIATGGSAVYGREAMEHFKRIGKIVYINLPFDEIDRRVGCIKERGISIERGKTLRDLYFERQSLYEKYADVEIDASGLSILEAVEKIKKSI